MAAGRDLATLLEPGDVGHAALLTGQRYGAGAGAGQRSHAPFRAPTELQAGLQPVRFGGAGRGDCQALPHLLLLQPQLAGPAGRLGHPARRSSDLLV